MRVLPGAALSSSRLPAVSTATTDYSDLSPNETMAVRRPVFILCAATGLALVAACGGEPPPPAAQAAAVKGGDDRNGAYESVADFWKPAPEHDATWTWGEVSGLAADTPDRIIVAVWGDRNRQNRERPDGTNYLVVVNGRGQIVERWQQWDSILNKPHQVFASWDGGWVTKYTPKRGADPTRLVGRKLVLAGR